LIHVGLGQVESGSAAVAAEAVLSELGVALSYFCVPAFTPSFRKLRIFDINKSMPEVGSFSRLCMERRNARTRDPIHSLFIFKDAGQRILTLPTRDTFAPGGVYETFITPGSCWLNIGTLEIVSTALHFIERAAAVPYLLKETIEGTIIDETGNEEHINQVSYKYRIKACWNRRKIEEYLRAIRCIEYFKWKSALVRIVDGHRAFIGLLDKLKQDPFFLVTG
jgi:aminoglycoside N3'-acetyltransferase